MKTTLTVRGTHCPSCAALIKDVCSDFSAIISCDVDYTSGKVTVEHEESLDLEKLKKEIESLGEYTVTFEHA